MKKKMIGDSETDLSKFLINLQSLQDQFEKRFQQFNIIESNVTFYVNPFTNQINLSEIAAYISDFFSSKAKRSGDRNFGSSE